MLLLAKIHTSIKDSFFSDKFNGKISNFTLSFINYFTEDNAEDMQPVLKERLIAYIDTFSEIFRDFKYMRLVDNYALILEAERELLSLKLAVLKNKKVVIIDRKKPTIEVIVKPQENKHLAE